MAEIPSRRRTIGMSIVCGTFALGAYLGFDGWQHNNEKSDDYLETSQFDRAQEAHDLGYYEAAGGLLSSILAVASGALAMDEYVHRRDAKNDSMVANDVTDSQYPYSSYSQVLSPTDTQVFPIYIPETQTFTTPDDYECTDDKYSN